MNIDDIVDGAITPEAAALESAKESILEIALDETESMRFHQDAITQSGKFRRQLWHFLNKKHGMTQQEIADHCGVTRQVVYLEIKRHIEDESK
jgi:predicted DNA-binding protein (UPF0251 family)